MESLTNHILMIRPAHFGFNAETAVNNAFQTKAEASENKEIQQKAIAEFDHMVEVLRGVGVDVFVVDDTPEPLKPDAVFPNNWISFHENGTVITYPMFAENRRLERRKDIIAAVGEKFKINNQYSFEFYEEEGEFLEGTGSMIIDRANKIVYACLSPRTHATLLDKYALLTQSKIIHFTAVDQAGLPIYHTNVMMALGLDFVVICLECIPDEVQKKNLISSFEATLKTVIEISLDQVNAFAGNMLEIYGKHETRYLVMSAQAKASLTENQISKISSFTNILPIDIPTIEKYGGGSVRCMMAEVFLPPKQ